METTSYIKDMPVECGYIEFFIKNLQTKFIIGNEGEEEYKLENEGTMELFLQSIPKLKDSQNKDFKRWRNDKDLQNYFEQLKREGMDICSLDFYLLCQYVLTITSQRHYVLLSPTIKETLEELEGFDSKTITFTDKDGKCVKTNNPKTIKLMLEAVNLLKMITQEKQEPYYVEKVVRQKDMMDKTDTQACFCYYLALFLQQHFKNFKRRANCCMVSSLEQKLILHLIPFWGLAESWRTEMSLSRFRQLISHYKKNAENITLARFPMFGLIPVDFVKYKDWKQGKIVPANNEKLIYGDIVKFQ